MRLLNSKTIELKEFLGNFPEYAILSHTWGDQEVLFQDIGNKSKARTMKGYSKIKGCCAQALKDGFEYVWIDTCCINKESSSELSEAINSMYAWYQKSQICYAYIVDVPSDEDPNSQSSSFAKSRWFTRGWTLQELLAPSHVIFYGSNWEEIGTKASLQEVISATTGVDGSVLLSNHAGEISIAKRMSWASKRETTREEDRAYSLMGIFGVNMPTIYGEGGNAFIRLQHEIMKLSDDQTIFVWVGHGRERGLLAHSPAEFIHSGDVKAVDDANSSEYSMTNKGLCIRLPLRPVGHENDIFLAKLNCQPGDSRGSLAIYLKKEKGQQYARIHPEKVETGDGGHFSNVPTEVVYVKERDPAKFDISERMQPRARYTFSIMVKIPPEHKFSICETVPSDMRRDKNGLWFLSLDHSGISGLLMFRNDSSEEKFAVMLGVHNYTVWTDVVTNFGNETAQSIRASYYRDGGRGGSLWRGLDRILASLKEGRSVSVSVRSRITSQEQQYRAEIIVKRDRVQSGSHTQKGGGPSKIQHIQPKAQYVFSVQITLPTSSGFAVSETLPSDFWSSEGEVRFLSMSGSGTSGILMFRNRTTEENFAVMLGVHNYVVWTDVVTDFGSETAQAIRESYYGGRRGNALWLNRANMKESLKRGRSVSVSIGTMSLLGQRGYPTQIIVN